RTHSTPCLPPLAGDSRSERTSRPATPGGAGAGRASSSTSPTRGAGFRRRSCPTCASPSSRRGRRGLVWGWRSLSATWRKRADGRLPGMSGLDLLKRIREFDPLIPVIMLTAYGSIEGAVAAVKLGAFDYIKKPVDLEELKLLADRARENRLLKQELSYYRRRATADVGFGASLGESPAIRAVLERARQIAALDETPPVLLTGETGTGKGLL